MHKLVDSEILAALRARHRLYIPAGAETVDVTQLSANQAAEAIRKVVPQDRIP